ncbi:hypothetical protein [Paenibacillus ferrarius]|nr:hypothetical protein [Paenibacillus ferrarius]
MNRMNISGLIRNLVGELTASDSKVLELKVGEIVKGVVLQLLGDQEALLNIGGVQVRAKLETPLKQGDVTMLQVQPESSKGGQILLKPLTTSDVLITEDSISELLKAFTVKDTAGNRSMVQQMQQEGIPVTKENVKAFDALMRSLPEGANKEDWMQAAVLAYKKGLPLTTETVGALKQVTTGPPVGQVLEQLEQQAAALIEQDPAHPAADTAKQVVALLKELRASAAATWPARPPEAPAETVEPAASQAGSSGKAAAPAVPPPVSGSVPAPAAVVTAPPAAAQAAGASVSAAAPSAESAAGAQPAADKPAARPAGAAEPPQAQVRSAEPARESEPSPKAGSPALEQPPAKQKAAGEAEAQARSAAPPRHAADPETNWISRMLKAVGVEHEAHLAAKLDERADPLMRVRTDTSEQLANLIATSSQQDDAVKPAADTLKSLLLQLTASDDTPAPLKEAAQQAIGQVTGQQLMLTGDKNAMFAHMTLFVPFMDGTGQQSAAIHIQSRKGKRGEVDASNCRLLFDLQMKIMGNTLLDVQVVNKIVSLNIHNDHPALAPLMEESKEEITAAMNKAGYQFISLKCSPYPQPLAQKENEAAKQGVSDGRVDLRDLYQPKTYKGVDFRA